MIDTAQALGEWVSAVPADTMTKDETIRLQATEIKRLRELMRDILADQQTAHWHEDIKEALGE